MVPAREFSVITTALIEFRAAPVNGAAAGFMRGDICAKMKLLKRAFEASGSADVTFPSA
jgi:hypothetical protein